MRQFNKKIINSTADTTQNSALIDTRQTIQCSAIATFADATAAGVFKLQGSNDEYKDGYNIPLKDFSPTWTDIPNQSNNVSAGVASVLYLNVNTFAFLRAVFTPSASVQTITPVADTGAKEVSTVTTVADVAGSLNSKYFLVSSINLVTKAAKNFYVWLSNGTGIDPLVPGRTAVPVVYTDNDSANTLGGLIRAALGALTNDFTITGANATVGITNKAAGVVSDTVDGAAPTGFNFVTNTQGVASNLNNKYFLLSSQGSPTVNYYVWFSVDAIGTDPLIAGKTAVPIAISSGSTAGTVGTAIASAIDALTTFAASGTTTVTVTASTTGGTFTPMSDGTAATGFTFAVTTGSTGAISVTYNALSV